MKYNTVNLWKTLEGLFVRQDEFFVTDKAPTKFSIQDTNFHKVLSDKEQKYY